MLRTWSVVVLAGLLAGSAVLGVWARAAPQQGAPPVRVGGNIPAPKKVTDVKPVYPPEAQQARVSGIVILELTIGTDGRVTNARVIRSVPLLDQAALDAVRQWVFTPTLLNGVPVPVLMSVTVNFSLDAQPQAETPNAGQPAVSPGGQPDPRAGCRYDADTLATEAPRRQAAVAFVVEVNFRERLAAFETQSKGYVPLSELRGLPALPDGFDAQLTIDGATYSVSATDTRDVCGFGVFSTQRGVVYVGSPVR
jgi:protein TonB